MIRAHQKAIARGPESAADCRARIASLSELDAATRACGFTVIRVSHCMLLGALRAWLRRETRGRECTREYAEAPLREAESLMRAHGLAPEWFGRERAFYQKLAGASLRPAGEGS